MVQTENKPLKLDVKRTLWIGLAFFGILLVWQLYNSYCSPMLSFLFVKQDYADLIVGHESLDLKGLLKEGIITRDQYLDVQWKVGIIMALDNIAALFIMPLFGFFSDKTKSKLGKRMPYIIVGSIVTAIALPFIPLFFSKGMATSTGALVGMITGLIAMMVVIIVFMMSYRSPAVSLMPDFTPKPLRSKANGLINIVGYVGGAIGSIFAIVLPVSAYIDGSNTSLWMLEIPFIVCSVVLLASLALLIWKVRENKLHLELDETVRRYDSEGESAEKTTVGKMSKTNIRNLALILIAEALWFMSLNAIETFQTNYCMFWLNTSSSGGAIMTIVSGAASIIGFLLAGKIADKIGRKWTIFIGICVVALCYVAFIFFPQASEAEIAAKPLESSLPFMFFVLLPTIGLGSSLIHICSFPLVTDYCTSDKLGRFTSLYYTASMLAQSVTPIAIGFIFRVTSWVALPIYSSILMGLAGLVFFFVKAPKKNDVAKNATGLDALGSDD